MRDDSRPGILLMLVPLHLLAACGSGGDSAADTSASTQGRLVFAVESAQTSDDGQRCRLNVNARNETGGGALNVQAAWMAQTEGFGIISDYQMLGDFAAGEVRPLQLSIVGAPCTAVRNVKLTRTVCVVGPVQDPPESCAGSVMLDGGGVVTVEQ